MDVTREAKAARVDPSTAQRVSRPPAKSDKACHYKGGVPVGRLRLPPPTKLDVAAYGAPSTTFAVLLALAHVIAASKITTTVKDFTAGDFMCAFPFLCVRKMPVFCLGGCDVGHRNTFQPKRIAGDKKSEVRQTVRSTARATKPTSQLSVQKIRFCNSGRSRGRVARSRLQRSRQTVERKR
jgi:hypothetical protein